MATPMTTPTQTIPVLNLDDFHQAETKDSFVQRLGDALREYGFFALENHGIHQGLIKESYQLVEQLFMLPEQTKRQYENPDVGQRGFISFGREHAKDQPAPDLKEFWHVGRQLDPTNPNLSKFGSNVWPNEVPGFKETTLELYRQLDLCSMHLLKAIALYMDLEENELADGATDGDTILRLIHYPPIEADRHPASVRAAAHEDINLITLLCESTDEGLELLQRDGTWLPIHALEGQIIVDSGDMLQNLSNGLLKATTHRVTNPNNDRSRRFSMPFFVHPKGDTPLDPRPQAIAKTGGQAAFPNITAGQYLDQRLKEIGLTE